MPKKPKIISFFIYNFSQSNNFFLRIESSGQKLKMVLNLKMDSLIPSLTGGAVKLIHDSRFIF
jgi:hypothetical protein